jgi:hypothetical protein
MKLKNAFLLLLLCLSLNSIAQVTATKEKLKIELKKAKLVNNVSVIGIRELKVTDDRFRKVLIKTKITAPTDNKTKLSAFSLLDTKNKIRYRLADYKGYMAFIGEPELIPFRKEKIFNEKGKEINSYWLPEYNESEKDYFYDYDIEGYTNLEVKINFGTNQKPKESIVYFGQTEYDDFTAELFFAILVEHKDADYQLYYKDEKIFDIQFDKKEEKAPKKEKKSRYEESDE